MINYRVSTAPKDMEHIVDLEIQIWGIQPRDAFPAHMLCLAQHNGGVIIIAETDKIIGFSIGFPARRAQQLVLWSFITGVHPEYQGQGIGAALKQTQRHWAAEHNYESIVWSFDPLQPGNANFNLNHLGAVARIYRPNLYGTMQDAINRGMQSDRLEAWWHTTRNAPAPGIANEPVFLVEDHRDKPHTLVNFPDKSTESLAIAIPRHREVNLQLWQKQVRRAFQHAFKLGYEAHTFVRGDHTNYYLLSFPQVLD